MAEPYSSPGNYVSLNINAYDKKVMHIIKYLSEKENMTCSFGELFYECERHKYFKGFILFKQQFSKILYAMHCDSIVRIDDSTGYPVYSLNTEHKASKIIMRKNNLEKLLD